MPVQRRAVRRFLLIAAPGALAIAASPVAYFISRQVHDFGFDKWMCLRILSIGALWVAFASLFHWKASSDERRLRRSYGKTQFFLVALIFALPVTLVILLDQSVAVADRLYPSAPLLVYPAHYHVSYRTPEFSFSTETNSIGIRDREVDLGGQHGDRVLAIGDSFTYGWGVDVDQSWPKVAERIHNAKDCATPVEILNLGCPGTSVDAYAAIAEKAIPLLKPTVVLVAVLQGDDIKQLDIGPTTDRLYKIDTGTGNNVVKKILGFCMPHVSGYVRRLPRSISADQIQRYWKETVDGLREKFTASELERYAALDEDVRSLFTDGGLNPWDVYFALKQPDYLDFTLHPEQTEVRQAIDAMASHLARIKAVADENGASVHVITVPAGCYVCRQGLLSRRRIGYRLDDSTVRSDAPDQVIRTACEAAGVPFHSCLSVFRKVADARRLYYEFDGHFNAAGHALFGEQIARLLKSTGDSAPGLGASGGN